MLVVAVAAFAVMQAVIGAVDARVPRALVELRPPQGAELSARYLCPGTNVRLHISAGYGWVKVTHYSASERSRAAADLKTWNDALRRLALFSYHEVSCQAENEQLVSIHGASRRPGERQTWVSARFSNGRLVEVTEPK